MSTPQFHTLTVAGVEPETDNAIKVSFKVPEDLADAFHYKQGHTHGVHMVLCAHSKIRTTSGQSKL